MMRSLHFLFRTRKKNRLDRLTHLTVVLGAVVMLILPFSCTEEEKRHAPAIAEKDSLPFMQSRGISTLISDSGVIRYKIVAEEWNIYNTTNPPKWTFLKGILLEKFDSTFHIDWFVQADTAYCHNQQLWELRGRVVIRNQDFSHRHTFAPFPRRFSNFSMLGWCRSSGTDTGSEHSLQNCHAFLYYNTALWKMHHVFVETSSSHLLLLYENIRKIGEKTLNRFWKTDEICLCIFNILLLEWSKTPVFTTFLPLSPCLIQVQTI